jgi:hypothetical protein
MTMSIDEARAHLRAMVARTQHLEQMVKETQRTKAAAAARIVATENGYDIVADRTSLGTMFTVDGTGEHRFKLHDAIQAARLLPTKEKVDR